MPNRIVRDAILTSQAMASLDWPEEVFYRRLMSVVDDYGRCESFPQLLRARCYPLQTDKVRVADITRWMAACQNAGLLVVYEIAGKGYLQVEKFGQQQRSPSKCPAPPALAGKCLQVSADAHLGVFVSGVVDVAEEGAAPQSVAPPPPAFDGLNVEALNGKAVVPLSAAWELPEAWGVDAVSLGFRPGEALHEGEKFRQFWTAGRGAGKRRTVKGWRQAWSNWLGKAAERTR